MNLKWNKGESMDGTGWTEAKMGRGVVQMTKLNINF